ncbi:Diguanylate cyclase [Vibrio sp. B1FLJ16]|uniref:GGDEF domain-containing protein n=1 Tax=Vibrio sp. B1FLJ16 TaxID=2751178 RepID=UPI0015F57D48|nr:diguanylate cyclase [Vibrio sp. B1FLJ16]CAD7806714.1 Diguanylate cyclase [Vibrio sp. B1FLJ16]CAE6902859.1 Diguanylate cyclase [Vibrio sp. B1FLJ16]
MSSLKNKCHLARSKPDGILFYLNFRVKTLGLLFSMKSQSIFKKTSTTIVLVVSLLIVSILLQLSIKILAKEMIKLQNEQLEFVHISSIIQKISDDLSHLSKMYVLTGESKYRQIYDEIKDIRDGNSGLPNMYHGFMSKKIIHLGYIPEVIDSNNISDYFKHLSSENPELSYIFKARDESNILSDVEISVMDSLEVVGQELSLSKLQDESYFYAKSKIINKREVAVNYIKNRLKGKANTIQFVVNVIDVVNKLIMIALGLIIFIHFRKIKSTIKFYIERLSGWGAEISKGNYDSEILVDLPVELNSIKVVISDIATNAKNELSEAKLQSRVDFLTGLPNVRAIDHFFIEKQNEIERYGSTYSVVLVNIKGLKQYNIEYGYELTNDMLVRFSTLIKENIRASDFYAYLGSGVYIISQPYATEEKVVSMIEKLKVIIEGFDVSLGNKELHVDATFVYGITDNNNIKQTFDLVVDDYLKVK